MASILSIPQEIIEKIIDELVESYLDRKTLPACALTCRAFYPRASALIFRKISFWSSSRQRIDAFRDLCHINPRLASLVKKVKFVRRGLPTGGWLSENLLNMCDLTLHGMTLVDCPPLPSFNQLSALQLSSVTLPRVPQANKLFKNNLQLSLLTLQHIEIPYREDATASESLPSMSEYHLDDADCVHPRELVIDRDYTPLQGLLTFICHSRAYGVSFSQLEVLTFIGVNHAYSYSVLEEIVRNAADHLWSMDVSFDYEVCAVRPGHSPTNFIHIPHVRRISFDLEDYNGRGPISVLEWWLGNLEQLLYPSPIETMTISLSVDPEHSQILAHHSHPVWKALDTFFQSPCAPDFQKLDISVLHYFDRDLDLLAPIEEVLLNNFPLLRESESLVVTALELF